MKWLVLIGFGFISSCAIQGQDKFNDEYLLGKWSNYANEVVEAGDTIDDPIFTEVNYDFLKDGSATLEYNEQVYWIIKDGYLMIREKQIIENWEDESMNARYAVNVISANEFALSRSNKGNTFVYYFKRTTIPQ